MSYNSQIDFFDILNLVACYISVLNLYENREQSAENNIFQANQEQAEYLLNQLTAKFEEQNAMLREMLELLKKQE